jgi:hypothetical protein
MQPDSASYSLAINGTLSPAHPQHPPLPPPFQPSSSSSSSSSSKKQGDDWSVDFSPMRSAYAVANGNVYSFTFDIPAREK